MGAQGGRSAGRRSAMGEERAGGKVRLGLGGREFAVPDSSPLPRSLKGRSPAMCADLEYKLWPQRPAC